MYFAIKDAGVITLKEIDGNLSNKLETHNEIKIIKTKVNGEVKVYVLIFNEVIDAKSLIMAHGDRYLEDKLVISDNIDDREYKLDGVINIRNENGLDEFINLHAERCKFVEFPLIDELLKIGGDETTQFISCLEVIKNDNGDYIEFSKPKMRINDIAVDQYYVELETNLIWKLVDIHYNLEIILENHDTTYSIHIDEFKDKFSLLHDNVTVKHI